MSTLRNRIGVFLAVLAFAVPLMSSAEPKPPAPKGKLVFVATTGLEDIGTLQSSFHHAQLAKESGYLEDVVWLSYGRAVVALDPTVKAVPEAVHKAAEAAQKAGVRLEACNNALQKYGIDPAKLTPQAKVVPSGAVELARLVSEGYQVIRY